MKKNLSRFTDLQEQRAMGKVMLGVVHKLRFQEEASKLSKKRVNFYKVEVVNEGG